MILHEPVLRSEVTQLLAPEGRGLVVDCTVDPAALLIPPAITPHMAANYVKSEIKSWFTPPSDDAKRLEKLAAKHSKE